MATTAQINAFVEMFAPAAQQAYATLGKVKPSVCIAMACVECGYGTAGSCKHHSYLGQKVGSGKTATKYWGGKFFTSATTEEYTVGVHTTINAAFRAYDSPLQCALNYYELLNTSLYNRVQASMSWAQQMNAIKACGYMTSSTEVNSVKTIINRYGLTRFDDPVQIPLDYVPGTVYHLTSDMYVRAAADGAKVPYKSMSKDAQAHGQKDAAGYGILNKGTAVTCKGVVKLDKSVWIQIPSGYVCAINSKGVRYVE